MTGIGAYGLAVEGLHAGLDLCVKPERVPLTHVREEEGLEVEHNFVRPLLEAVGLLRNDRRQVCVPASDKHGKGYEYDVLKKT